MDSEEVALDWDEDEEVPSYQPQQHHQDSNQKQPLKDEATLELVAESLLALRQTSGPGGPDEHDQEDRYSDAVSLGSGGEDDMEQLHAYQSRTHLGGVSPVGRKSTHHSQRVSVRTNREEHSRHRSPSARSPPHSIYPDSPMTVPGPDEHSPRFSSRSQRSRGEARREERTDLSSLPRLPSGSLALPPKPSGRIKAPFLHPSNPAMMSASSMAPAPKEREGGDRRPHGPSTDQGPPLAPHWEVRTARDGSGDQYYYNTKTHESTWNRAMATDSSMNKPPTSGSNKDQHPEIDIKSSSPGINGGQRGRPFLTDDMVSSLSIRDRHYSPPVARNSDVSLRHIATDAHTRQRSLSPSLTSYPVSHHGNDRDVPIHSKRERDERPAFKDHRNGEKRLDRERSRSPVRDRWRTDAPPPAYWDRAGRGQLTDERHGEAVRRGRLVSSSFDRPRGSSLGRNIGVRYPPNEEQSSFRDRQRSPPSLPLPSARKRTRSKSPDVQQSFRPAVSQSLGSSRRWEEREKPHDHLYSHRGSSQDRSRPHSERPSFSTHWPERFAPDGRHFDPRDSRNEDLPNEAKRRRTSDHPDSAPARRYANNDDRQHPKEDERRRKRLSPQEDRTATSGPSPSLYSRNLPPRDESSIVNSLQHPQKPPPPRREYNDTRGLAGPGRSPRFPPNDIPGPNRYHDRERGWNRDKERNLPPPSTSRFGREPDGGPTFDRRGPPPARSQEMIPMLIPSDAYRAREARKDRSPEGYTHPFDTSERGSHQSRVPPPRDESSKSRYSHPAHSSRPPLNSASDLDVPKENMTTVGSNEQDIRSSSNRYESRDEPRPQRQLRGSSFSKEQVTDPIQHSVQSQPRRPPTPTGIPPPFLENSVRPPRLRSRSFREQVEDFPLRDPSYRFQNSGTRWGPSRFSEPSTEQQTSLGQVPNISRRPPSPPQMPTKVADRFEVESRPSRSPNIASLEPITGDGHSEEKHEHDQVTRQSDVQKEEHSVATSATKGMHPERARLLNQALQPGAPPPRGRFNSGRGRGHHSYRNFDHRDQVFDEHRSSDAPPPLMRQGSLLERISDPTQAASLSEPSPAPSLRDRVSDPPEYNNRGRSGQGARGNPGVSLRDRLENSHPLDNEVSYNNIRKGTGNGTWRGWNRDSTRGRRGRGQ